MSTLLLSPSFATPFFLFVNHYIDVCVPVTGIRVRDGVALRALWDSLFTSSA